MQEGSPISYNDENRLRKCLLHVSGSQKAIPTERVSRSNLEQLSYPKKMLTSSSLGDLLMYLIRNTSGITEPSI